MASSPPTVHEVFSLHRELNRQFGRFFLEHARAQRQRTASDRGYPGDQSGPTSCGSTGETGE